MEMLLQHGIRITTVHYIVTSTNQKSCSYEIHDTTAHEFSRCIEWVYVIIDELGRTGQSTSFVSSTPFPSTVRKHEYVPSAPGKLPQ